MNRARFATVVLRVDAAANLAAALACLALAGGVADLLGLGARWPVVALAAVLAANGLACWRAAASGAPDRVALRGLAVVDAVFAVAVGALALADPTGMAAATRWVLAGVADVALLVGVAKLFAARGTQQAATVAG